MKNLMSILGLIVVTVASLTNANAQVSDASNVIFSCNETISDGAKSFQILKDQFGTLSAKIIHQDGWSGNEPVVVAQFENVIYENYECNDFHFQCNGYTDKNTRGEDFSLVMTNDSNNVLMKSEVKFKLNGKVEKLKLYCLKAHY